MNARRQQGLGRGLGDIFGAAGSNSGLPREIPVGQLTPGPWQPRQQMNATALGELAQTIEARGVLQPIIVRPGNKGTFQIIAGERRWRASQLAGLRTVPAIVREFSDRDAMLAALVENIQREDLHVLEQAAAARRIIKELKLPLKQIAPTLGMSRPALSNLLRLLELAAPVRKLLANNAISPGHARAVAGLPADQQATIAKAVIARGLTVRQVEALGQTLARPRKKRAAKQDPDTARLCAELSAKLGMRVEIHSRGQHGKLLLHYRNLDSLDSLLKRLRQ